MKRTPAVALSLLLAPFAAFALGAQSLGATNEMEPCCKSQPGRIETAREIKTEAENYISKGRELSQRVQAQIQEAEKLKHEALKLQAVAHRLSERESLIAQSTATESKTPAEPVPATENKAAGDGNAPVTPGPTTGGATAGGGDKPAGADDAKPAGAAAPDGKPVGAVKSSEERLTGRASELQTLPMPNIPLIRLKGPQLQQAMKQFNNDVEQFKIHAADYNKHYNLFRSQIGECHAAKSAFDSLHKKYEMHCDTYHLNNIPPPKLCPPMNASVSEANSIANQLRNDQMRALRAEAQLNAEEGRLKEVEAMSGKADALVVKSGERDRREREIAGMFGRLRQEYDLLEIERKTIDHSRGSSKAGAPVVRPYVSGQIKKRK